MPLHDDTQPTLVVTHRTGHGRWQVADDAWPLVRAQDAGDEAPQAVAPAGPALVPLAQWLEHAEAPHLAPWLPSDTELDAELFGRLADCPVIAIDFPVFVDGRGYSLARLLRERFGFEGEIRAVGDVLIDQLFYMSRCGFDAFLLREDQVVEDALQAQHTFSVNYQGDVHDPEPLFVRRLREVAERRVDAACASERQAAFA